MLRAWPVLVLGVLLVTASTAAAGAGPEAAEPDLVRCKGVLYSVCFWGTLVLIVVLIVSGPALLSLDRAAADLCARMELAPCPYHPALVPLPRASRSAGDLGLAACLAYVDPVTDVCHLPVDL